ncbi:hypothetical protein [Streptomyces sp. NPDC002088]|uniref:hypothetical protein n=1 Tax=Streptomyces sp. NPDC002088 TaxID=3154665 RepID=UPI003318AB40
MDWIENIGGIVADEVVPVLEQGARERGMSYREYVEWIAHLPRDQMLHYRDQIVNGDPEAMSWGLYSTWNEARGALHEVQTAIPPSRPSDPIEWER